MKKTIYAAVFLLLLSMVIVGCSRGGDNESTSGNDDSNAETNSNNNDGPTDIQIGSGTQTGNYYPLGSALAKVWDDEVDDVNASSQATDASVENLQLIKEGDIDAGFAMFDAIENAYDGEAEFEDNQFDDVRVLAGLYPNVGQVVARQDEGIDSFTDFEGEGFVPGATGSATKVLSDAIMDAYDMTEDDLDAQFVGFDEATDLMKNKQVVGAQVTSGLPTSAIVEMLSTADGELIDIDDDAMDKLTEKKPVYFSYSIPEDTYDEQESDIDTVAVNNGLVVYKDLDEDTAYEMTKALWENIEDLQGSVEAADEMELETATENLGDIPLHPGAEKYYEEEGVLDED